MNDHSYERGLSKQKDEFIVTRKLNARVFLDRSVQLDPQIELDDECGCDFGLMVSEDVQAATINSLKAKSSNMSLNSR